MLLLLTGSAVTLLCRIYVFIFVAQQPHSGLGRLIDGVSRSHTHAYTHTHTNTHPVGLL